ncbi:hypothetical protein [uncultured Vagococcus sp.]|uniref:hypothetical protein n=1 Tax=uncultured Vagococcus sp. TaxID=189676 RepID=UPI0028D3A101|nr:hypothetical protein [uncultured Vagococcus sp.]
MNNLPDLKDVVIYVKDNKKNFISAAVIALALFGMFFAISVNFGHSTLDPKEDYKYQFEFIVENKEGNISNNPQTIKYVLDHYILNQNLKTDQLDSHALIENYDITYNNQVGVMTLKTTGERKVNQLFYDIFKNSKSEYFADRSIYLLSTHPEKYDPEAELLLVEQGISLKIILLYIVGTIVTTILVGFLLSWMKDSKSQLIRNRFSLFTDVPVMNLEKLYLQNNDQRQELLRTAVKGMNEGRKLVIAMDPEVLTTLGTSDNFDIINNLLSEDNLNSNYQEVILICRKNNTTKVWYNTQLELLKNLNVTVKCIYF